MVNPTFLDPYSTDQPWYVFGETRRMPRHRTAWRGTRPSGRAALYRVSARPTGGYKRRRGITRFGGYKGMGSIYGSVPKFNDVTDVLTTTAEGPIGADKLDNISAIDIGTGPTDRNAQCVALRSIYMNFNVLVPAFTGDTTIAGSVTNLPDVNWQILVVLDRQPNKAALTAALIWEDTADFKSPLNLDNRKRIKVLKKFKGHMTLATRSKLSNKTSGSDLYGLARGTCIGEYKYFLKFKKPLRVEYDTGAVTGVIGDIVDNAISVWLQVNKWGATLATQSALHIRTRFVSC